MKPASRLHISLFVVFLSIIMVNFGISGTSYASRTNTYESKLPKATYAAGDHLEANLIYELDRTVPILSTSFVNLDNLTVVSSFGRLLGEQIASRFSQHGYRVIDLRVQKDELVSQERKGRLALPKGIKAISSSYDAQAIIVGTYIVANDLVYVSARIVRTLDDSILSSYDFTIRLDETLKEVAKKQPPKRVLKPRSLNSQVQKKSQKGPKKTEKIRKKSPKGPKRAEKPYKNGPFATGTIALNPRNRLAAKIIQSRLAELGYYTSKIDGKWRRLSREALKAFKTKKGLRYASRWDMATQKALFRGTGQ